jgi:hypothetical protein
VSDNAYQEITNSSNFQIFEFISEGKSTIRKRVKFKLIDEQELIYNLALCTVFENGAEDYSTASKNSDMQKIFETIAVIAYMFTNQYPDRKIFFGGSDTLRVRQYRLSVFSNSEMISNHFHIEGLRLSNDTITLRENYRKGQNYDAFILTRKS